MKTGTFFVRHGARVRLCALPLALAAAFPPVAQAQDSQTLQGVVVTASRVAVPVTDVIADVSIIDRAVLEQAGQGSVRDLLAQQPGIQISSNGGYRSSTGVFLRGASSSQTLVLVDGVRVGSATLGTASFENMPLDRIERIEILRGAASALYGPDAVGGVIQIFTREPAAGLALSASAGVGSDGQRQLSASVRGTAGSVGYSVGVSHERATGISALDSPAVYNYNPDRDGFRTNSVDAKLTAKVNADHRLTFNVLHSQTQYQFDGMPYPNPLELDPLATDAKARPQLDNATLKWDAQWMPQWRSTLVLAASADDSPSDYHRTPDGAFGGSDKFNTRRKQATWQNDVTLDKDILSLMVEKRFESVDSSTAYTVDHRIMRSAMVSYAFNRTQWNALAVLRNDRDSQFGGFNNWALSGGYKLTEQLRVVGSLGTSFQAPSFNQLYFPNYGKPTLTPQLNRASELGLRYQRQGLTLGALVYRNRIQGFIVPATNVQSAMATLRGATLNASLEHGATSYALSYDYADPRTQPSDMRFVRVARNVVRFSVNHRMGDLGLFGEMRLSSNREDNNFSFSGRDIMPGYGLLNVGASWKLRKDLSLLARVNNLTAAQYSLANGYSVPGRNAFVSLSWSM